VFVCVCVFVCAAVWYSLTPVFSQPMLEEYSEARARIYCNECEHYCVVPFRNLGHRCDGCGSFNTVVRVFCLDCFDFLVLELGCLILAAYACLLWSF